MKTRLYKVFQRVNAIMLTKVISKSRYKVLQREEKTITSKGLVFFSLAVLYSASFKVEIVLTLALSLKNHLNYVF